MANNQFSLPAATRKTSPIKIKNKAVFFMAVEITAGGVFKNLRNTKKARTIITSTKYILINENSFN